jgi:hypothetical protein
MRSRSTLVLAGALISSIVTVGAVAIVTSPASAATNHASALAVGASGAGAFTPVGPSRIMDSRINFGISGPLAQTPKNLQVTNKGGVPGANVSAVVFNLTVVNAARDSYVTVWPAGKPQPTASNINFARGFVGANLVTVKVGDSGQVTMANSTGTVDVVADVVGWYSTAGGSGAGNFQTVDKPTRMWDSRPTSTLPGNHVPMAGLSTLTQPFPIHRPTPPTSPNGHVTAVVVSITAVNPQSGGYFTAWSGVGDAPTASVLNWTKGAVVPNLAIVPVSDCQCPGTYDGFPSIKIKNGSSANTDILIDLWGFYDDGTLPDGLRFSPLNAPIRIVDTRSSLGATTLGSGSTRQVFAPASVADQPTSLLVQNVTAVPKSSTYLTLYPHGLPRPDVSNLNPRAGRVVAGLAYTGVGETNDFDIFNSTGIDDVVIDVAGSMERQP